MKLGLGCSLLATLGLISCGGTSGSTSVSGDNPAAIKAAPAGASTTVFMDVELIRPDILTGATVLPTGVGSSAPLVPMDKAAADVISSPQVSPTSPTTLTFTNCKAANGGVLNGTITVGWVVSGGTTTYTETFNSLTVTPSVPVNGVTPANTWVYSGQQQIAVTGSTAVVTIPAAGFTATYTDNTVTPVAVKSYQFTIPTPLQVDWTSLSAISLSGEFMVSLLPLPSAQTVTVDLQPALIWNSTNGCNYPISGTLTLDLNSVAAGTATTTVVFSSTCGAVTIGGAGLNLGQ